MQHIHRNNISLGHRAQRFIALIVSIQHMELNRLRLAFTLMLLIVSLRFESTLAAAIRAEASFSPPQIAQGDQSRYRIDIIESSTRSAPQAEAIEGLPQLQVSNGLRLRNGRREVSRQTQIINGQASYTTTLKLSLEASSQQTGEFSVAAFELNYKGQVISVPAASLVVVERPQDAAPPRSELIQFKARLPEQLYLGQSHVAQLQLYLHESVQLQDYQAIQRNANAFTIPELADPVVRETMLQGHRFKLVEWPVQLTPIQAGEQTLNFHTVVQVALPENPANRRASPFPRSAFGGSLFNRIFRETETVELETAVHRMQVRPLPTIGQPEGFSGAIGQFNIELSTDRSACQVQAPITLALKISGSGNFPRIQAPKLALSNAWRDYPPDASMEIAATDPLRGSKRFEYILRPQIVGQLSTPHSAFSYFDPESASYVELEIPGQRIDVSPGLEAPSAPTDRVASSSSRSTENSAARYESEPFVLDTSPILEPSWLRQLVASHISLYAINGLLSLLCLVGFLRMRHTQKLRTHTVYRVRFEAKKLLKSALAYAHAAQKNNDLNTFTAAAQDAIRCAITSKNGEVLSHAELPEIMAALDRLSVDEAIRLQLQQLFEWANQSRYAPQSQPLRAEPLCKQYQKLKKSIRAL